MTVKGEMMKKKSTVVFIALILFWLPIGTAPLRAGQEGEPVELIGMRRPPVLPVKLDSKPEPSLRWNAKRVPINFGPMEEEAEKYWENK